MRRRRKLANTRARREKEDEENLAPIRDLLENEDYRNELYSSTLQVILNRLESQTKEFAEFEMLNYAKRLFSMSDNEHSDLLAKARQHGASAHCIVRVLFQRGEGLAPKDKNGLSDPYCMVSMTRANHFVDFSSAKLEVVKTTECKERTLAPEWNETIDLFVNRSQVDDCYVQVQVWDLDANTMGVLKKAGKSKGVGK